jgi:aspartyl-tRNA(Asn)/glutamyl-tRNA(Gln) amidotransferase subunit B
MKIGLEIHCQLTTQTKLFCGCANKFVENPNMLTCDYCIGLPGSKPRVNAVAIDFALKIALALNCKIPYEAYFSRKTYFYPDMGKNFQITQYEIPIASNGFVKVGNKKITITRIQIEEDPARIVHMSAGEAGGTITEADYTLLDYNRSGVPLCEIVTEPEFTSPREARLFLQELSSILQYLDVYNPDTEGSMRVDANISLGPTRVEIKNISGFKDVEKALSYEIIRQKNVIKRGQKVARETRHWDAVASVTRSLRTKEEAEDYGYIFEADLPKISIHEKKIEEIKKAIPELGGEKIDRYAKSLGIGLDLAISIASEADLAEMFEAVVKEIEPAMAAKWFAGDIKKTLNFNNMRMKDTKLTAKAVIRLLKLVENKKITETTAELILRDMIFKPVNLEELVKKEEVERIYSEEILGPLVKEVLEHHTKAILDYKSGKIEALNFMVGAVMKKTKGRGDSETIRRLLLRQLQ